MYKKLRGRYKNFVHFLEAVFAIIRFKYPARKLFVIGVTGTDGKTTTVHLIYSILKAAGKKVGFISTIEARVGNKLIDTGFHVTTPKTKDIQKILSEMVKEKMEYVVLESTSHGLDQHRVFGCNFQIGVLTNVTHEHLDYHKTFEKYRQAKAKLFKSVKYAVLNQDDASFSFFSSINKKEKILSYGLESNADYNLKNYPFKTSLPGDYNLSNCLAAISTAKIVGIDDKIIRKAIRDFSGITGRLELITGKKHPFKVYVDFAHTPNGLENLLTSLKNQIGKGRLITVFGCAGERDKEKRPLMGKISAKYSDCTVITAEDPRSEKVEEITNQIIKGFKEIKPFKKNSLYQIPDRQEAINYAIKVLAKPKDIVVICGKGHEKSMCFGKTEYPWSDQEAVKKALTKSVII